MADRILVAGEQLTAAQVAKLLLNAGFSPAEAAQMVAIAKNESSYNAGILNDTAATGDYSVGLWQINYYGQLAPERTALFGPPTSLASNPQAQADAAYRLYKASGYSPWQADFNDGTAQSYLAQGAAAVQAALAGGAAALPGGPSSSGLGQTSGPVYTTSFNPGAIAGDLAGGVLGAVTSIFGGAGGALSAGEKAVRLFGLLLTPEPWVRGLEVIAGSVLAINAGSLLVLALLEKPLAKVGPALGAIPGPVGVVGGTLGAVAGRKYAQAARTASRPAKERQSAATAAQRAAERHTATVGREARSEARAGRTAAARQSHQLRLVQERGRQTRKTERVRTREQVTRREHAAGTTRYRQTGGARPEYSRLLPGEEPF